MHLELVEIGRTFITVSVEEGRAERSAALAVFEDVWRDFGLSL
jgi:hypothetical protein